MRTLSLGCVPLLTWSNWESLFVHEEEEALSIIRHCKEMVDVVYADIQKHPKFPRALRKVSNLPLVCFEGKGFSSTRTFALLEGADACVDTRISEGELTALTEAVVRRANQTEHVVFIGDLEINMGRKYARKNGENVHLTHMEWEMLSLLVLHRGNLVDKPHILDYLHPDSDIQEKIIDVMLVRLRRKLGREYFTTLWGRGIIFGESQCSPTHHEKESDLGGKIDINDLQRQVR